MGNAPPGGNVMSPAAKVPPLRAGSTRIAASRRTGTLRRRISPAPVGKMCGEVSGLMTSAHTFRGCRDST